MPAIILSALIISVRAWEGGGSFAVSAARLWINVPLNTRKLYSVKSLVSNVFKTIFAAQQHWEHLSFF